MNIDIENKHKLIIDIGSGGDAAKLSLDNISKYYELTSELLRHPLPAGKENRHNFIKGLVLLENNINLGSTSQLYKFMERLDLYQDTELMDWILTNRNNPYIPFGRFWPPLEVRSYSQYLEYDKKRQEHREKMLSLDIEKSRLTKERKSKIQEEHAARKRASDEKRNEINKKGDSID